MAKTISPAFATYLGQPYQQLCTCWMVTRQDGQIFAFTDHDESLNLPLAYFPTQGGRVYQAAVGYRASNMQASSDLDIDNMEVQGVLFDSTTITESSLYAGKWDFARVSIFLVNWSDFTMGPVPLMAGHIGKVTMELGFFRAELRSLMQAYTRSLVALRTPACRADLGDTRCKVKLAPSAWAPSTGYATTSPYDAGIGGVVRPTVANGRYFYATTGGSSSGSEPTWNTTIGATTTDGGVTWTANYALTVAASVDAVNPNNQTIYCAALTQPGPTGGVVITAITNSNPGHVTLAAPVPVQTGEAITLSAILGMPLLNVVTIAHNVSGNTFDLGINTSSVAIYGTFGGSGLATPLGNTGFFDGGVVTFTSGDNIGLAMEVKTYVPGQVTLALPMPYTIRAGDGFTIRAGCDKQITICKTRFKNIYNMRAEPYIPGQDRLMQIGSHS